MEEKMCFLIGHRYAGLDIKERLTDAVEKHIVEYGVNAFTVGRYGGFDAIVKDVLREVKKRHEHIKLYLLDPYALTRNPPLPEGFEGTIYPEGMESVPRPYAIVQANRYMIRDSNYLIAYCKYLGNTRNFVEYAQRREKKGLIKVTLL